MSGILGRLFREFAVTIVGRNIDTDAGCGFGPFDFPRWKVDQAGEERAEARGEERIEAGAQRSSSTR